MTTDSPKEVALSTADTEEIGFVEFDDESFPVELKAQVLSFLRLRWPEGFSGDLRYRDWITRPEHLPHHLLYVAHGLVVSHLEIVRLALEHQGVRYQVGSLTSVLTFPSFRGEGWATKLVREAGRRIDHSDADIGIVFCDPALSGFYAACGWTPMPHARTLVGGDGPANATESSELLLMRFLSDRGRRCRDGFLRSPLWIEDEW